jgi:Uma2 family endonuclease
MVGTSQYKGIEAVPYPKHLPAPGTPLTIDELALLRGEGWRLELVDGRLEVMSPAGWPHGIVCQNVLDALSDWNRSTGLGQVLATDTGARLGQDNVRAPDGMWISKQKLAEAKAAGPGFLPSAPDLAFEVLSPSDTYKRTGRRIADLLGGGCRMLWLIDPEDRWLEVHRAGHTPIRLAEGETLEGGDVLPGFSVRVAELFLGL